jgi:hypothetical protein
LARSGGAPVLPARPLPPTAPGRRDTVTLRLVAPCAALPPPAPAPGLPRSGDELGLPLGLPAGVVPALLPPPPSNASFAFSSFTVSPSVTACSCDRRSASSAARCAS